MITYKILLITQLMSYDGGANVHHIELNTVSKSQINVGLKYCKTIGTRWKILHSSRGTSKDFMCEAVPQKFNIEE